MQTFPVCPCCDGRGVIPKRDPKWFENELDKCRFCNGSGTVSFYRYLKFIEDGGTYEQCPTDYIDDERGVAE